MLPPKHCNINLTGPIPRWDEAIPLGNGILGSLFWGPMEHLRISVDIAGLWLRRRPEEKLDKEFTYAKLVELARKGDVAGCLRTRIRYDYFEVPEAAEGFLCCFGRASSDRAAHRKRRDLGRRKQGCRIYGRVHYANSCFLLL